MRRQPGGQYVAPAPNAPLGWTLQIPDSMLEAVEFNGCIWLFAQTYRGKKRIENSGLYYWVPPKDSKVE